METNQQVAAIEATTSPELPTVDVPAPAEDTNPRKRQREQDDGEEPALDNDEVQPTGEGDAAAADGAEDQPKLSKNQQRKLKRQKLWEERRQDRKVQRKEKRHSRTAKNRQEREEKAAALVQAEGIDMEEALNRIVALEKSASKKNKKLHVVPVSLIIDCDFEQYMHENEIVSLGSQVTRSYSMNRQGDYQTHILISSWGGKLKQRFETVVKNTHKNWKGVSFVEGDFVEAGKVAWDIMHGPRGGTTCPALGGDEPAGGQQQPDDTVADQGDAAGQQTVQESAPDSAKETSLPEKLIPEFTTDSIIYLSADSPHTLDKLEPNTSYVIGGLVDRNREKLLCQRRAEGKNIRTAKLPIGEYMQMASRQVLATNHVVEIMSKWLETGDWGKAFMEVIPKRKGGRLRSEEADEQDEDASEDENKNEKDGENGDEQDGENGSKEGEQQADDTANAEA
ncbi:tRNA (guanine(9)-N(1))-methyltransferase [Cytospora paraplurivora]|uniref:tRNA (guanine(9)-N1)-methyltransferase n=1 Tax=Cytospora paraplurivora TaxID=2898453 RepID=A0AAN9UM53_9PEZI